MKKMKNLILLLGICGAYSFGTAHQKPVSNGDMWAGIGYYHSKYNDGTAEEGLAISVAGIVNAAIDGAVYGAVFGGVAGAAVGVGLSL